MSAASSPEASSSDDDLLIDNALDVYLQKRKEELRDEFQKQKLAIERGHGKLTEVEEPVLLDCLGQSDDVVCHFFHPDFKKCALLDVVLEQIAREHYEAKFVKVNVLEAGFFVNKYKIQTLPVLCVYKKGVLQKKIVGYEGFGLEVPVKEMLCRILGGLGTINYTAQEGGGILGIERSSNDSDSSD